MAANSSEENRGGSVSPNGSIQNSEFFSSTMTSLSDDRNSLDSMDKKSHLAGDLSTSPNALMTAEENSQSPSAGDPDTPTSKKGNDVRDRDRNEQHFSRKVEEESSIRKVFSSAPLGSMNLEAEQSSMQQQIVDMYMRSMQQFTESLAKMKLPMDLDKPEVEAQGHGDVIQHPKNKSDIENKKKDGSRVFYGSRAFF